MKSKLGLLVTLVLALMLTACDEYRNVQAEETPWHCEGICRTWVVFDNDDHGGHMIEKDKFQIQQLGENINFVALSQLKLRWGKELREPFEFNLTQIGGKQFGPKSRLCGFVDIPDDLKGGSYMFKINLIDKNLLEITWDLISSSPEIELQPDVRKKKKELQPDVRKKKCEDLDKSHGGTVHAEPN